MLVYGLKTCDTCRKALKELRDGGHDPQFVDLRETPPAPEKVARFTKSFGERLINRRSLTWRGLSEKERAQPLVELLADHPAVMKRPLVDSVDQMTLGWDAAARRAWSIGGR